MKPTTGFALLFGYGIVMVIIAYLVYQRTGVDSGEGFFVADRRATGAFVAASAIANIMWGADLLAVPETVYLVGIAGVWIYGIPIIIGFLAIIPLSRRLRKVLPNAMTYQEFFYHRLDYKNHLVYTGIGIYTMLIAAALQLRAAGEIIGGMASIDPRLVAGIIALVIFAYSFISGIWASMSTDWIQAISVAVLVIVFIPMMLLNAGGIGATYEAIASQTDGGKMLSSTSPSFQTIYDFFLPFLLGWGLWGITSMSIWQRSFSVRKDEISKTFTWATIMWFATIPVYAIVGLLALAHFPELASPDQAGVVVYTGMLGGMAEIVFALLILGTVVSTADSSIIALSLLGTRDIYLRYVRPDLPEKSHLDIGRIMVGVFTLVAFATTLYAWNIDFLTLIWINGIGMTAVFFPLLYCLYWETASANAVFVSAVLVLGSLSYMLTSGFDLPTMYVIGHGLAAVLTPGLSLIWPADFEFDDLREAATI